MTRHKKSSSEKKEARKLEAQGVPAAPPKPKLKKIEAQTESRAPGRISRLLAFFKDCRRELHWVTWPTRQETVKSTGVLLVLVGVSALYLGIVDAIFTLLLGLVTGQGR
ncbi:MAG: preprotein translocase subunit SecE [Deltaproteobacteria bacterium]|jgi:preprotein translocase SecE subunit|nr:preprotein translocase subunit SecE [Deltaproteobacteria bacterium]